ncbi:MAG TPA: hypothetical protein VFR51_11380 [Pyrinomonadaceae bacterium]|nr:hypothetical protein [Pyrinomonadaceae bacterium]
MPDWISNLGLSRVLSLLVAIGYLVIGFLIAQPKSARDVLVVLLRVAAMVVFPLLCIWFSEEFGDYVGPIPSPGISKRSPAWMVTLGGWFLLLLPLLLGFFIYRA